MELESTILYEAVAKPDLASPVRYLLGFDVDPLSQPPRIRQRCSVAPRHSTRLAGDERATIGNNCPTG
ncbi:hypothetical protein NQ318_022627 [Aromia moschata]|uniref:Uncharacterized protein n=1 Tax=Aromia moschata TaxID=1265417 RepID=A0AAV8YLP4_9CUCU|nr:hypothetical protein NQ318_022627 [Aromia moschata]